MLSFKDYAREYGVTYEAVRQQVKRYQSELEGHIHQQGRTQYLDDVAVAFLSEHRAKPVMAVYDGASDRRIQELEQEVKDLNVELKDAYKEQAQLYQQIGGLKEAQLRLQAAEASQKALEAEIGVLTAESEAERERTAQAEKKAQEASERAQRAETELAAYKALPWYKKIRRN